MKNDGADSPLPPVAAEDSETLARPAEEAPMPPRPPMPHARIRPTASFPRVSITSVPAQRPRPSMAAIPVVTPFPTQRDENDEDAITQHRESPESARDIETTRADTPGVGKLDVVPPSSVPTPKPASKPGSKPGSEPRTNAMHDAPSATSLVQGDVIGGLCRIEERLAISEMSVLYRAFHLQLERMVVVKVLQDAGVENVEAVARFKREARLMSLVTSEHVAKVIDVGSHEGCPFIVMERLEGADLAYLLKQVGGRLSLKQACDLVLQICEALAVAHSHGIVHRDLKPANVFVSVRAGGDLRVTIIDFGIAKAFFQNEDTEDQLTKVNGLLGSPRYMAPEQVEPRMEVDERADIWALGILFQEMLTGERVFAADGIVPLLIAIVESAPVSVRNFLPDAPDAVVATIAGALEKDPTRRLPNALTFAARVAPFASPDAIQRVANIAAIAAAAAERAADSRPASSERVTMPPKPAPAVPRPLPPIVSLSPGKPAPPASSNPPPTKRLARGERADLDVVAAPPSPPSPRSPGVQVAPVAPVVRAPPMFAPVPEDDAPLSSSAFGPISQRQTVASAITSLPLELLQAGAPFAPAPPPPTAVGTPMDFSDPVAGAALDAEDAAAAAAMRRSPLRSKVVLTAAAFGVAAVAIAAVMLGRSTPADSSSTGAAAAPPAAPATTAAPSADPSAAATPTMTTASPSATPSASASTTAEPAQLATAAPSASAAVAVSAHPAVADASVAAVAIRPLPSASAASPKPAVATGTGKLTVVCLPKCDQILDNGAVLGNGYVFGQDVPAGHHMLVLSTPAGVKKTMAVDVPADAVKDVRVSMDK